MCRASGRVGAHSAALALVVALASAAARAASGGGGGGARGWRAALAAHEPWQRAARRHVPDGPWARERGVFDPSDKHPLEDLNPPPPHPVASFDVGGLGLGLRRGSRTVQTLTIVGDMRWGRNFSFVPPLWNFWPPKRHRDQPGAHHLGDLTVRVQPANETNASIWATYSSAWSGDSVDVEQTDTCVTSGVSEEALLDCSDVTAALTARPRSQIDARWPLSLRVVRSYERAADGRGGLIIRWRVENNATSGGSMRIGGLGFSIVPDATWGGLNLTHVAAGLSFADAYAGGSRGSLMWNRADGSASLLITPADAVVYPTQLEAYRPILEDTAAVQWGTYEWTVHSAAWASEWASNRQAPFMSMVDDENHRRAWPRPRSPWPCWQGNETFYKPNPQLLNAPTDVVLAPGESREYALRLSLVENGPRGRAQALLAAGEPLLRGTPGFVIPTDVEGAALHVWPPAGAKVISVKSDDTSMLVVQPGTIGKTLSDAPHTSYSVRGIKRGRVTLRVHFSDGTWASVHYYVLPPLDGLVRQFGNFSANVAWLPADFKDPFGRSASVMPWDREDKTHVLQDARPFVVGLSDDAGGGATLGLATKVAYAPTALEASRLDDYVALTLDGVKPHTAMPPLFSLQDMSNDTRRVDRILMTLFYWNHSNLPASYYTENAKCPLFPSWCSFNARTPTSPARWINVYRQYNFPHQVAVFWALYRTARHQRGDVGAILRHSWDWYLGRACDTIFALGCCAYPDANRQCTCVPGVGLMDGTVFREVLVSLEREGWGEWAALVRSMMYNRTAVGVGDGTRGWLHSDAPFGSEFNWDTTGQEEVGVWGEYFGVSSSGWWGTDVPLGARVADAVLAYTPSMPNWQLHGSAAGWGDFSNNVRACGRAGGRTCACVCLSARAADSDAFGRCAHPHGRAFHRESGWSRVAGSARAATTALA